ncbi:hypothetical protein [uncultured Thermosynechococcus sp.]|uniref:hypothetical protein n=1 Tax=uncultured Thermosynechococcus sp. TaxID=436945 RepID=UPI002635D44A|nr:hypothetical protein [uncultured Thermosynechococcus sp.]
MNPPLVPGNRPFTPQQKDGLAWVGRWGGRDGVLAIDPTESVGLNGNLGPVNRNPDVSRRRVEVRFTRMGYTETAR